MAKIRFENITYRYGTHTVLENFSLTIEESQIMGIVGPSGCGKTTLIRCLCGFIRPESGSIYIGDVCVFSTEKKINIPPEKRQIGVVFQDYAVWPHLSVLENVMYPMKKRKRPKEEMLRKAKFALAQVRMTEYEKHLPAQLSGGQQQRVAIARALVSSQDVIVLDEPITNLDAKLREEMLVEIRGIQQNIKATILYITHDQEAALKLCDKIAIMEPNGALCQVGTDEEIIKSPASRFVFSFIGVSNFIPLDTSSGHVCLDVGHPVQVAEGLPQEMQKGKEYVMGIRPLNILFDPASPIRGKIRTATFLGNQYSYFVTLGNLELRVQRNTLDVLQSGAYQEGDEVGLTFVSPVYYEKEESAS